MAPNTVLIRKRLTIVLLLSGLALFCLVGRLSWIQFVWGKDLENKALEVRMRDIPVEAKRGNIYDRNGRILVSSVSVDSVYAIPSLIREPQKTAETLSPVLKEDVPFLYRVLTRPSCFEWLGRKLDLKTAQKIKSLNLSGVFLLEESKRFYPLQTIAPHLLGFTGIDNQGLTGIEKSYDDQLKGTTGRIIVEQDAIGQDVPEPLHKYLPPKQGSSLVLTIDETIQQFVERELDKIVLRYQPKLAVIVVMDPGTGEILAIGNRPTFNSNKWEITPAYIWDRNPAIWYNYEPGSTFKIVTMAAGFGAEVVKRTDPFFCPGYVRVADRIINCWLDGGHGSQTFEEVAANSCNVGFVELGLRLGVKNFYKYINDFGFGEPTGINLPGEETGLLIPEKDATNLNVATMAIGQSIAVTPIQLVSAVAAIANGGDLLRPQVVREIRNSSGNLAKGFKPEVIRRVVTEEEARQVRELLEHVVTKGTGKNAFIDGYRVAGKTGTAQVVGENGGYVSGRYVSSFAGFAPSDKPRLACLVMVAEPQGGIYYGSQVAAPVFQAVVRDSLHYLRVPETPDIKKPPNPFIYEEPRIKVKAPNVINYPVNEGIKMLSGSGLTYQLNGRGNIIYGQMPAPGVEVYNGVKVVLNLKPLEESGGAGYVTMPNLKGLTMGEVAELLRNLDLNLEFKGTGIVESQEQLPGKKVKRGSTVRVNFAPPGLITFEEQPEEAPAASESIGGNTFIERP